MSTVKSRLLIASPAILTVTLAIGLMWAVGFGWPWPDHWRLDAMSCGMTLTVFLSVFAATWPTTYPWEDPTP